MMSLQTGKAEKSVHSGRAGMRFKYSERGLLSQKLVCASYVLGASNESKAKALPSRFSNTCHALPSVPAKRTSEADKRMESTAATDLLSLGEA